MTKHTPDEEYLNKAALLTKRQAEFLMMRMHGKLERRIDDHEVSILEALAIQLEIEDEHRNEWREKFSEMKARFDLFDKNS